MILFFIEAIYCFTTVRTIVLIIISDEVFIILQTHFHLGEWHFYLSPYWNYLIMVREASFSGSWTIKNMLSIQ